jgi:hypothetical protein
MGAFVSFLFNSPNSMGNSVIFDNLFGRDLRVGRLVVIPQDLVASPGAPNLREIATRGRYDNFPVPFRVPHNLIGGQVQFFVCSLIS